MKSPKIVAILLFLNFGLFAGILLYLFRAHLAAPMPFSQASPATAAVHALPASVPPPTAPAAPSTTASNNFHWGQLESEAYPTYIARLRAIGCPEQTLRDIIVADLDKLLAPQLRAAYGRRQDLKYWHPEEDEMLNDVDPAEIFRQERDLDKRKREILRELVNADLARERMKASGQEDYYERRLKFLPEQRRTQVRELLERFDEEEQQVRAKSAEEQGVLSGADRERLRVLRQQRETELSALLSARDQQLYELWLSPVANEVRHATYGMEATEQEFLAIYEARKAFQDTWGQYEGDLLDPATEQQLEQARGEMSAKIQASLGDERFAAYQRGQDQDFHLLSALVTRFKLPKEKAAEVYGFKAVTSNYRTQLQHDSSLNAQQKEEAWRAITEETQKSVRAVLGNKAYQHYIRSGQGRWMNGD